MIAPLHCLKRLGSKIHPSFMPSLQDLYRLDPLVFAFLLVPALVGDHFCITIQAIDLFDIK